MPRVRLKAFVAATVVVASVVSAYAAWGQVHATANQVGVAAPPSAPQGDWVGAFGSEGYVLGAWNGTTATVSTGDLSLLPAGVSFTLDQGSRWCWTCPTTDGRALQSPDTSQRRAATWYHATQLKVRLNFTGAYQGNLRLYALDFDNSTQRRESIVVNDGSGNQTVDITTNFSQGAWLTFPINITAPAGGTVDITVNRTAGANAILSGIFLGDAGPPLTTTTSTSSTSTSSTSTPSTTTSSTSSTTTSTTAPPSGPPSAPQGTWVNTFGSQGYVLGAWNGASGTVPTADLSMLPTGASFTLVQGARWCWTCPTTDARALQTPDTTQRRAATWYHATQLKVRLNFTGAYQGNLRLYVLDFDNSTQRRESIVVNDGSGNQTVDITTNFSQGAWTTFPINVGAGGGTVNITVNRTAGANAILSGIFLGDAGPPLTTTTSTSSTTSSTSSTTTSSTTTSTAPPSGPPSEPQGTWVNTFGSEGYVLGAWNGASGTAPTADLPVLPTGASFALVQGARWCWTCSTADARALQSPDTSQRRAATWYHATQLKVRLSLTGAYQGNLRLYALDFDNTTQRRESIVVNDGAGDQTVDITTNFSQGAWLTFPINVGAGGGPVNITVNRTAGANAILSGIFLGNAGPPPPAPPTPPPSTSIGQYCAPTTPSSPGAYQTAVDNLRKANTGWASADGSVPVALPDGRALWLYGDTFVGTVNSAGVISSPKVLVENSAVLQTGRCFNPLMRGSPSARAAWIPRPASGQAYWPSSGVVDAAGNLQVFLMHVRYEPFTVFGFRIATFSLPDLTLVGIGAQLGFTSSTLPYGTTALVDGGYAYLYSANNQNQRVARVPLGSVTSPSAYQFWTGSAWSSSAGAAGVLQFSNVPTPVVGINLHAPIAGLWVTRHGSGYLGTAKLVNQFSDDVSLFTAPAPQGPWTYVNRAATTPSGLFSYGALTAFGLQGMGASPAAIYSTNVPYTANTIVEYGPRFVAPANMPAPPP